MRVRGTLDCESAVHVGGIALGESDLPLAEDGRGQIYVPGTSLAGALRAWARRNWGVDQADLLFGNQPAARTSSDDDDAETEGGASRLLVEDCRLVDPRPEVREGVGIDRVSGAAAERVKFDQVVLPRGTKMGLELELELSRPGTDPREALLDDLLAALWRGEVLLGAAQTRGLGRVRLSSGNRSEEDLGSREGLLRLLRDRDKGEIENTPLSFDSSRSGAIDVLVEIAWEPDLPVMLASGLMGGAVDTIPLTSGAGLKHLIITGSGLKGVLRTQAERIVRTLLPDAVTAGPRAFLDQVRVPLVERLFGSDGTPWRSDRQDPRLGRGAVEVRECYSALALDAERLKKLLAATDSRQLYGAVEGAVADQNPRPSVHWDQAHHVAIDRWTGGAAEGLLYSSLEPWGLEWDPIRLGLDLHRVKDVEEPALALLLLVVRDLALGRLSIGWGTRRGLGSTRVGEIRISVRGERLQPLSGEQVRSQGLGALLAQLEEGLRSRCAGRFEVQGLQRSWRAWVAGGWGAPVEVPQ
jgi:CRISPR/Cas system CSM-associated protein Csm3 (group 7 of RAMP superfamily)